MEQIIKTLPAVLRASGNSREVAEAATIAAWKYVAGEPLSKQAVALKLEAGTLVVAVSDAVWQKQLDSMRRSLVLRLNAILEQPLVSRLEFQVDAEFWRRQPVENTPATHKQSEPAENDVSLELRSAANAIQDKRLRRIFLAAAASRLRQNSA